MLRSIGRARSSLSPPRLAAISVVRLAADENFNSDIVRGLVRRKPDADIVRMQDVGLSGANDAKVLEWAAGQGGGCW